ncbi:arginase [Clostridium sartagoforme]|uniref:Arginase n=1 Tax=Clostridium sartagoforme TaxID=84031 RepID=A0A4S2DNK1_9CLOT|nr:MULTISPECIES: arginase [Clostridium]MBS5937069.1 arginase [Clostridium sp.]TGY43362.1 arginase [Clostridium sartagoforme]
MNISIIDMPLFYGCDNPGVEQGPKILRENNLLDIFNKSHNVCDMGEVHVKNVSSNDKYAANAKMKYLDEVVRSNIGLADKVYTALENSTLPLVIGGDHSLAIGSIAGASKYFENDLAVVWVDAHGDINTLETSPSGNIHGMPLASSMGIGHETLTNIYSSSQKVKPENVFLLGCRDLDLGELEIIKNYNLNIWTMKDIKEKGISTVLKELLEAINKKNIKNIHLSFDIDSLDPKYVPGTGTPVEDGLSFSEGKEVLETILNTSLVKSMDFVEFNPVLDKNKKTLETCIELLKVISNNL